MKLNGFEQCLYIVKNRNNGYENRRTLTKPPTSLDSIIARLKGIAQAVKDKVLLEVDFDPQSLECRRCEYKQLCVPAPKALTPIEEASLSAATADWRHGKQLVSKGQELIDRAKEVFETHTKATNILKWRHSGLAIQLVHYKESTMYPKAKLLKVFTEEQLEPCAEVKEAYDQLRVTDLETNGGV